MLWPVCTVAACVRAAQSRVLATFLCKRSINSNTPENNRKKLRISTDSPSPSPFRRPRDASAKENSSGILKPMISTAVFLCFVPAWLSRYSDLATGWTVLGSDPGVGKIFRTHPNRPWGPPSLPQNGYRVSF